MWLATVVVRKTVVLDTTVALFAMYASVLRHVKLSLVLHAMISHLATKSFGRIGPKCISELESITSVLADVKRT